MHRSTRKFVISCLALSLFLISPAIRPDSHPSTKDPTNKERFKKAVADIIAKHSGADTEWGVAIRRADTGESFFEKKSLRLLVPASNRKLFTTALALDKMGPAYSFQTALHLDGELNEQGHLHGNIRIRGSGDPTFLNPKFNGGSYSRTLRDWAKQTSEAGVRYIHGDVIIDCSSFLPSYDAIEGLPKDYTLNYTARPSCVTINENCIALRIQPGSAVGRPAQIKLYPANSGVKLINSTKTGRQRSVNTLNLTRPADADVLTVSGNVPSGASSEARLVALRDAPKMAGAVFKDLLRQEGITVQGEVKVVHFRPAERGKLLAAYDSPPLTEIVKLINTDSNNFCAEQLYLSISRRLSGLGSYPRTYAIEREFLKKAGIASKYVEPVDGSGLSRNNKCTADAIVRLLSWVKRQNYFDEFKKSLAVSGKTGTLQRRMGGKRLSGRVYAKTGTLNGVSCLSGYYITPKGTHYVFSILVNNLRASSAISAQNKILDQLARIYGAT